MDSAWHGRSGGGRGGIAWVLLENALELPSSVFWHGGPVTDAGTTPMWTQVLTFSSQYPGALKHGLGSVKGASAWQKSRRLRSWAVAETTGTAGNAEALAPCGEISAHFGTFQLGDSWVRRAAQVRCSNVKAKIPGRLLAEKPGSAYAGSHRWRGRPSACSGSCFPFLRG